MAVEKRKEKKKKRKEVRARKGKAKEIQEMVVLSTGRSRSIPQAPGAIKPWRAACPRATVGVAKFSKQLVLSNFTQHFLPCKRHFCVLIAAKSSTKAPS